MSHSWRRLVFGLSTLFGIKPLGFFIPYRYAFATRSKPYVALREIFQAAQPKFASLLCDIESYAEDLRRILEAGPARFDQDWFPRLDAAAAYTLVRRERPRRIIEIGSGHSTRFLARAIADGGLQTHLRCIDPQPRASLSALDVDHVATFVQNIDPAIFEELRSGDIFFIDSSHVAMPGSDVDFIFLDILPRLPAGILIHIHDVTLPDVYPESWEWRGYNEQLLVGALLQGGGYTLEFSSHSCIAAFGSNTLKGILGELPFPKKARETSLWLRKN